MTFSFEQLFISCLCCAIAVGRSLPICIVNYDYPNIESFILITVVNCVLDVTSCEFAFFRLAVTLLATFYDC